MERYNHQSVEAVKIPQIAIDDRAYDNWYTLLQIASVLGVYDKAVNACLAICQTKDEPSQNEQLLADIRGSLAGRKNGVEILIGTPNSR